MFSIYSTWDVELPHAVAISMWEPPTFSKQNADSCMDYIGIESQNAGYELILHYEVVTGCRILKAFSW